jgi:hypothetical protein
MTYEKPKMAAGFRVRFRSRSAYGEPITRQGEIVEQWGSPFPDNDLFLVSYIIEDADGGTKPMTAPYYASDLTLI